jgi:hypothetical protein
MIASTIRDLLKLNKMLIIAEWMRTHKVQAVLIIIGGMIAVIAVVVGLFGLIQQL